MKSYRILKLTGFIGLTLFCASSALADSLRCGNSLVRTGDTTVEVKLKCGQPFDIENTGKTKVKNSYVEIERYTYIPEKGKFVKILEFQNGKLVEIINGPRV